MEQVTHNVLALADVATSLGILGALVILLVRGDIVSRSILSEVIAATVREVLEQLDHIDK